MTFLGQALGYVPRTIRRGGLRLPRTPRATAAAWSPTDDPQIRGGNPLRHDHAPRVDDQLAHLGQIDRLQPNPNPVVTQIGLNRHEELLWLGGDQRCALFLRKGEAHRQPVAAQRQVDHPAHSKLDLIPGQRLLGPRLGQRNLPDVICVDLSAATALPAEGFGETPSAPDVWSPRRQQARP
jgi:hypothetical protein